MQGNVPVLLFEVCLSLCSFIEACWESGVRSFVFQYLPTMCDNGFLREILQCLFMFWQERLPCAKQALLSFSFVTRNSNHNVLDCSVCSCMPQEGLSKCSLKPSHHPVKEAGFVPQAE